MSKPVVKFLIIRFSSIGDIVLTTPIIRCLKKQVENAEIHYLTKKAYSSILKGNPYIDKIHEFDKDLNKTISELKKENFHYVIDLHHNLRSSIVKIRLNLISFSFPKINFQKWLLVNFKINILPKIHIVERYFSTLKLFDVKNDNEGLDYFIPPEEEVNLNRLHFQSDYIAFAIGGKHNTKKLPAEKIISICTKINIPVILLGGEEDEKEGEHIQKSNPEKIYNACGRYTINQSASILKNSLLVITHDTGMMHIAAALKKKIISIWGNTIPEFGMYPYLPGKDSKIIEVKELSCRPCSKLGYKTCPKKHFRCMIGINEDELIKAL